jgi:hypothetical protein
MSWEFIGNLEELCPKCGFYPCECGHLYDYYPDPPEQEMPSPDWYFAEEDE